MTRRLLCEQTGLSLAAVNTAVSLYLDRRVLCEEVYQNGSPGRPAGALSIHPDLGRIVGLDIGGQHSRAVLTDMAGHTLAATALATRVTSDPAAILEDIVHLVQVVCEQAGAGPAALAGVGIGLRAIVDMNAGLVLGWPNTPAWNAAWTDLHVTGELEQRLAVRPVVAEDSVRAMGVAAHRCGVAQGIASFLYVFLAEGIGSAMIIDGQPYRGSRGLAGELGHIQVLADGAWCSCGNRGCLEAVASSQAILQRVHDRLSGSPIDSVLREPFEQGRLTLDALLAAAAAGDKVAFQILDAAGNCVGEVVAIALNLLGPGEVVIGGPLTEDGGIILDAVRRQVRLHALRQISRQTPIVYSPYDAFAGARGMAFIVLDRIFGCQEYTEGLLASGAEDGVAHG